MTESFIINEMDSLESESRAISDGRRWLWRMISPPSGGGARGQACAKPIGGPNSQ